MSSQTTVVPVPTNSRQCVSPGEPCHVFLVKSILDVKIENPFWLGRSGGSKIPESRACLSAPVTSRQSGLFRSQETTHHATTGICPYLTSCYSEGGYILLLKVETCGWIFWSDAQLPLKSKKLGFLTLKTNDGGLSLYGGQVERE